MPSGDWTRVGNPNDVRDVGREDNLGCAASWSACSCSVAELVCDRGRLDIDRATAAGTGMLLSDVLPSTEARGRKVPGDSEPDGPMLDPRREDGRGIALRSKGAGFRAELIFSSRARIFATIPCSVFRDAGIGAPSRAACGRMERLAFGVKGALVVAFLPVSAVSLCRIERLGSLIDAASKGRADRVDAPCLESGVARE